MRKANLVMAMGMMIMTIMIVMTLSSCSSFFQYLRKPYSYIKEVVKVKEIEDREEYGEMVFSFYYLGPAQGSCTLFQRDSKFFMEDISFDRVWPEDVAEFNKYARETGCPIRVRLEGKGKTLVLFRPHGPIVKEVVADGIKSCETCEKGIFEYQYYSLAQGWMRIGPPPGLVDKSGIGITLYFDGIPPKSLDMFNAYAREAGCLVRAKMEGETLILCRS